MTRTPHPDDGLPPPLEAGDPAICDARTMVAGREFYCPASPTHKGWDRDRGHRFVHVTPDPPQET